jgi:peptidoglycan hydrolase-like protein with peptidoglycan-binding domain
LGGVNRKEDSMTVQDLLNKVPPDQGGPAPLLDVDGLPYQKTIAAIKNFQRVQVGMQFPDGRVDPNGPTLAALNTFDVPEFVERLPPGKAWLV